MLSQVLVGIAVIICGVNLGGCLLSVPAAGGKWDIFLVVVVAPAMVAVGGMLGFTLGSV